MPLYLLYLLGIPALVMFMSRKWRWIERVSPMAVLYIIGLLTANLTPWLSTPGLTTVNDWAGKVCIPLSIPLMLITCNLSGWSTGKALKAFGSGMAAILITVVAGYFLFRGHDEARHFAQVCAVAVGIYTGGIPNMGSIAHGVGMDSETYLYITSYDLLKRDISLYDGIVFHTCILDEAQYIKNQTAAVSKSVICFGKPVFRKLLPQKRDGSNGKNGINGNNGDNGNKSITSITSINSIKNTVNSSLLPVSLALLIAGASYLLSTLFPEGISTPMLILLLTTLSIGASFLPPIRRRDTSKTFSLGLYFVYVFCFSVANACNIRQMDLAGSLNILWLILFIVFGSLVFQILFAKLLHLDGDTTLVTSVTLVNSPPFVPMVATLLGNKEVIVLGITIGLLGYMVGNYLGLGMFLLLSP